MKYCLTCGHGIDTVQNPASCPACGGTEFTDVPPSQESCAYCGARPTWPVIWGRGEKAFTLYLCHACDIDELEAFERD